MRGVPKTDTSFCPLSSLCRVSKLSSPNYSSGARFSSFFQRSSRQLLWPESSLPSAPNFHAIKSRLVHNKSRFCFQQPPARKLTHRGKTSLIPTAVRTISTVCAQPGALLRTCASTTHTANLLLRQLYYGVHEAVIRGRLRRHEVIAVQVLVFKMRTNRRHNARETRVLAKDQQGGVVGGGCHFKSLQKKGPSNTRWFSGLAVWPYERAGRTARRT